MNSCTIARLAVGLSRSSKTALQTDALAAADTSEVASACAGGTCGLVDESSIIAGECAARGGGRFTTTARETRRTDALRNDASRIGRTDAGCTVETRKAIAQITLASRTTELRHATANSSARGTRCTVLTRQEDAHINVECGAVSEHSGMLPSSDAGVVRATGKPGVGGRERKGMGASVHIVHDVGGKRLASSIQLDLHSTD